MTTFSYKPMFVKSLCGVLSADFGFGLWSIIEGNSTGSPTGVLQSGVVGNVQAIVLALRGEPTLRWDRHRKEEGV